MRDNYEPNENINHCENCVNKLDGDRCRTCKYKLKGLPKPIY